MRSPNSAIPKGVKIQTAQGRAQLDPVIDRLIEIRKQRGMTQNHVDCEVGGAERLCSKWESRQRYPSLYKLLIWSQVIGATLTVKPKEEP